MLDTSDKFTGLQADTPYIIRVDGRIETILPADGKSFGLAELQGIVGGYIELIDLPSGKCMVLNEEGKNTGLQKNEKATQLWQHEFPIEKFPLNNDEYVVGDVLVCSLPYLNEEEENED